jgi:hypothetical protein
LRLRQVLELQLGPLDVLDRDAKRELAGDGAGAVRRELLRLERGDRVEVLARHLAAFAVCGDRTLGLLLQRRPAPIVLVGRRDRGVLDAGHRAPDLDRALGWRDDVALEIDQIHVARQVEHDPHEPLLQMLERRLGGERVVGVDAVEERIGRVCGEPRADVGGRQHGVLVEHVAGRAGAPVGVGEGLVEQALAAPHLTCVAAAEGLGDADGLRRVVASEAAARRERDEGHGGEGSACGG